jgi:hypothetical protein
MTMRALNLLPLVMLVAILPFGCEAPPEEEPAPPPITRLPLDPTDRYEITRWWANGEQLLRLDESGAYALYPSMNRYNEPVQRGRWSKRSYAMLRLEPYERFEREWIRVGVTRIDDRIALNMLGKPPMFAVDEPPTVHEDRLLGTWSGERGTLSLWADGSYHYSAAKAATDDPVVIAGHDGTWSLDDERIVLDPTPPMMSTIELWIEASDGSTILAGPGGVYEREAPAAPPVS